MCLHSTLQQCDDAECVEEAQTLKKQQQRGKMYCCIPKCHNYFGKILDSGVHVTLHRFPADKQRRRVWIQKIKTVRANLNVTNNTRVCCDHFVNGIVDESTIPSLFPTKEVAIKKERRTLNRMVLQPHASSSTSTEIHEDLSKSNENQNIEASEAETSSPTVEDDSNHTPKTPTTREVGIQCNLPHIFPEDLENSDEKVRFYTGFVSYGMFFLMFQNFMKYGGGKLNYWAGEKREQATSSKIYRNPNLLKPGRKRILRPFDEYLLICMKLRLGLLNEHLSDIFVISSSTVSRIVNTWTNFMYDNVKSMIAWPSKEQIMRNLPNAFAEFPNCQVILDCTEFKCERPSSNIAQWLTWSDYKSHNTFKLLVGVTPNGFVNFISRLWGGRTSDRHITKEEGVLPRINPGMSIMADKGFTIADLLPPDVELNIPPRRKCINNQMTPLQVFETMKIASPRIVVEMKMSQIKNYRILQGIFPLSEIHLAEQIIFICTAFTNLLPPLLK